MRQASELREIEGREERTAGRPARRPIRPFARSLPMQLMRVREMVLARFRPRLKAHGMTDQQWRIIRVLAETESLEILELSRQCCIHPASLSRILPKLEASGYIARRTNKADQRRVIVSLAAGGRRLFERVSPELESIYDALAEEIGAERLAGLYAILDSVAAALGPRNSRYPLCDD